MTKKWKQLAVIATLALAMPVLMARALPATPPTEGRGYTMPSTQAWDMTSDSGETYRIFVSYPETEAPADGWPVLYVLDGNAIFAGFAETRRIQEWSDVGKSLVVGVGYPIDLPYGSQRTRDFTACPEGTREKFLDFLTGQLRAELAKRHKINLDRQALFGHSYGGLLAIHVLYTRPDAFHAIISASPSLFKEEQEMLKKERDFTARLQAGKIQKVSRLMVVAGEHEEIILERWDAEALIKRIEPLSAYGLRTQSEIYAGEGHMAVPSRAIVDTLRFAFGWP